MIDSRLSRKASNKLVGDILGRSRKRILTYILTAQVIDSVDKRVRKTCDFLAYPVELYGGNYYRVLIFRSGVAKNGTYLKTIRFNTQIPYAVFDSYEEIDMIDDSHEEDMPPMPKIMWQEAKFKCLKCNTLGTMGHECQNCGERKLLENIEPIYFETYEEADSFAEKYWENKLEEMNMEIVDD